MQTPLKFVAAALLVLPLVSFSLPTAMAQTAGTPATPDPLCDYCKDYTDTGVSAGSVRSAYRPGTGYASKPEHETEVAKQRLQEEARMRARVGTSEAQGSAKARD
jgi:hypothetical protein